MLEELMRRCREDGHTPTYQDLVALQAHLDSPAERRISLLESALSMEHSRLVDALRPIPESVLRAEFERTHTDTYGFRRGRQGGYANPTTAAKWNAFRKGAEFARGLR